MTCEAIRPLLNAHLDRELDPDRDQAVEHHLDGCPACAQAFEDLRALQGALRTLLPPTDPPPHLQARIQLALRKKPSPSSSFQPWWRKLTFSLVLVLVVVGAVALVFRTELRAWLDRTPQQVAASHERYQTDRQLGIASSDPKQVQAWLAKQLPFAPPVPDLARKGYRLVGGRVDTVNGHSVAVLEYEYEGHSISFFVWPAEPDQTLQTEQVQESRGLHLVHWSESRLVLWAVSDLDEPALGMFVERVRIELPLCH